MAGTSPSGLDGGSPRASRGWDIFCRVVDNFGDVGVCWRLSRQLANERGHDVRLWVDDLATLARIEPALDPGGCRQTVTGVDVRLWTDEAVAAEHPRDIVVEAFACETPPGFVERMVDGARRHAWINLEYLSAERWVEGCHRLPSPHPRLALVKHFFFPGFTPATGGLLRERDLFARRDAFAADDLQRSSWWREVARMPAPATSSGTKVVSMFAYPNPAADALLRAWIEGPSDVVCLAPEGILRESIARVLGTTPALGHPVTCGRLQLASLPFVPQDDYDKLLWISDVNFVRGEDSFVRAQWAGRPFVWHIYPQAEEAHAPKLTAFVDRYVEAMDAGSARAVRDLFEAWNGLPGATHATHDIAAAWKSAEAYLSRWSIDANRWAETLTAQPDLAASLAEYADSLL